MHYENISISLVSGLEPKIKVVDFDNEVDENWQTLDIDIDNSRIVIFTNPIGIINLKNQVLWAFEKWERMKNKERQECLKEKA